MKKETIIIIEGRSVSPAFIELVIARQIELLVHTSPYILTIRGQTYYLLKPLNTPPGPEINSNKGTDILS
jgi:hypothetical protein